jgi:hypothetical protein
MGGPPVWWLGEGLTIPYCKKNKDKLVTKCYTELRNWTDSLERPRQRKMDMRFRTSNVRSLYGSGLLKTVSSELAKYKLNVVAVQDVRCKEGDSQQTILHCGSGNTTRHVRTGFFVHQGIRIAVTRVEFISDRMSCITLRGPGVILLFLMCMHQPTIKVMTQRTTFTGN